MNVGGFFAPTRYKSPPFTLISFHISEPVNTSAYLDLNISALTLASIASLTSFWLGHRSLRYTG
jgi:hypothetical protein